MFTTRSERITAPVTTQNSVGPGAYDFTKTKSSKPYPFYQAADRKLLTWDPKLREEPGPGSYHPKLGGNSGGCPSRFKSRIPKKTFGVPKPVKKPFRDPVHIIIQEVLNANRRKNENENILMIIKIMKQIYEVVKAIINHKLLLLLL